MRTVRPGTFETNSSSMHSLVINSSLFNLFYNSKNKNLTMHAKFMDYSVRELIPRTDPEDKFAFLWMIFCSLLSFPKSAASEKRDENKAYEARKWPRSLLISDDCPQIVLKEHSDFVKEYITDFDVKYTDTEKANLENRFKRLENLLNTVSESLKSNYSVSLDFTDLKLNIHDDYGYCNLASKSESYPSTGTYGNKIVADYFEMEEAAKIINDFINSDEEQFDVEAHYCVKMCFREMLGFAYDKDSIFIQDTDEHDNKDEKKHIKLVKKYFNKGNCEGTVLRPIGG